MHDVASGSKAAGESSPLDELADALGGARWCVLRAGRLSDIGSRYARTCRALGGYAAGTRWFLVKGLYG